MSSSVPRAKANLLAILTAAMSPVTVTWGYPVEHGEREHAWLDSALGTETPSIGQVSHREDYIIPVVVSVRSEDADMQLAEERAWTLVGLVEAAVLANPDLSGAAGVTAAYVSAKTPDEYIIDGGRRSAIIVEISVKAKV